MQETTIRATNPVDAAPPAWRTWLRRLAWAGLLVSLGVHAVVGGLLALVWIGRPVADAGGNAAEAGFSVMLPADPAPLSAAVPDVAPVAVSAEAIAGTLPVVAQTAPSAQPALLSASSASASAADSFEVSSVSGGQIGASFFGLEAQGRRFAYVVDVSSSMAGAASDAVTKMDLLRRELSRSIDGLGPTSEFVVILYAGNAADLMPRPAWMHATDANKLLARQRVARLASDRQLELGITADGTEPDTGFERAFRLRPPPDAVYFMTDGLFQDTIPDEVARMNRGARATIHCVLLAGQNDDPGSAAEPLLRRIARESGGKVALVGGGGTP